LKFLLKIEIFVKNRNFCQRSKFLSKIKMFVKNQNVCQKSKFLSKIKIFIQNQNSCQKSNVCQPRVFRLLFVNYIILFNPDISDKSSTQKIPGLMSYTYPTVALFWKFWQFLRRFCIKFDPQNDFFVRRASYHFKAWFLDDPGVSRMWWKSDCIGRGRSSVRSNSSRFGSFISSARSPDWAKKGAWI